MNFTKIISTKKWQSVVTEDLNIQSKEPLFVLAGRFNVHRLKVLNQNYTHEILIAFVITGNKKSEKLIIFLEKEHQYNMVVNYSLKKSIFFDRELSLYLVYALIIRLLAKGTYHFSSSILQWNRAF